MAKISADKYFCEWEMYMSALCAESFPVYHYSLIYGDIRMGLQKEQPYSMNSAYSPWSMGCGFASHQAN